MIESFYSIKFVKIRFRINHLLQEVEQVDDHVHPEVDGRHRLEEVGGLDVRIKLNLFDLFTNIKLTWRKKLWSKQLLTKSDEKYKMMSDVKCMYVRLINGNVYRW